MRRTEEKNEKNQAAMGVEEQRESGEVGADARRKRSEGRKRRSEQPADQEEVTADEDIEVVAPISTSDDTTWSGVYDVQRHLTACLKNLHSRLCVLEILD